MEKQILLPILVLVMIFGTYTSIKAESSYNYQNNEALIEKIDDTLATFYNEQMSFKEKEYIDRINEINQRSIFDFQDMVLKSEEGFLTRYNIVLTVIGITLAIISFVLAILFGVNIYSSNQHRNQIKENIEREQKIIKAHFGTIETYQNFKDEKNELISSFKNQEILLQTKMTEFEETIIIRLSETRRIISELRNENRIAFRELNSDLLNIVDNLIQDTGNIELYEIYRTQILEHQHILSLYSDDWSVVEKSLHTLHAMGTIKSIQHLEFYTSKLKHLRLNSDDLDKSEIEYIYKLAKKTTSKLKNSQTIY